MEAGPSAKRMKTPNEIGDERTVQLLARFMNSQGIPYDAVNEGPLQELIRHLNPNFQFPLPKELEVLMDGATSKTSYKVRDVSVTLGVSRSAKQTFVVYSAHLLLNLRMKKSTVFMRKMDKDFGEDPNDVYEFVRYEVQKSPQFWEAKVKNIVVPDQQTYDELNTHAGQYRFLCFNYILKLFAEQVIAIPEFVLAVEELREFIDTIRADPLLSKHFKKNQLSDGASLHLPTFGDGSWHSTAHFLAKSIEMYPTFTTLMNTMDWHSREDPCFVMPVFHIANPHPRALFQLLQECVKFARENSNSMSSISQVIPSLRLLERFIKTKWAGKVRKELIDRTLVILNGVLEQVLTGEAGMQYQMAMLLDPRFGYRVDLFSTEEWSVIETKVATEIVKITGSPSNIITTQLQDYSFICHDGTVPNGNENPLSWWMHHQRGISAIIPVARELFTVPASAIDADYFCEKFRRVCDTYEEKRLDDWLSSASSTQTFRGRGTSYKLLESYFWSVLSASTEEPVVKVELSDGVVKKEPKEEVDLDEQGTSDFSLPPRVPLVHELRKFVSRPLREPTQIQVHATNVPYSGARRRRVLPAVPVRPPTCSVCGFRDPHDSRYYILQMEWERLLTAYAAHQLGMIAKKKALTLYNKNTLSVCKSHFLGLTTFIRRADFSSDCELMEGLASKTFSRKFGPQEFREWCTLFMEKFEEPGIDPFHVDAPEDDPEYFESKHRPDAGLVEEKPTDLFL